MSKEEICIIKETDKYVLKKELVDGGEEKIEMIAGYAMDGSYIGNEDDVRFLCTKKKIKPERAKPDHSVASIGFCEDEQKWYGWSHRAIYGFGIGSQIKKGCLGYRPSTPEELFEETTALDEQGSRWKKPEEVELLEDGIKIRHEMCTPIWNEDKTEVTDFEPAEPEYQIVKCGRGEWAAETLEDAKIMAIDFADAVD